MMPLFYKLAGQQPAKKLLLNGEHRLGYGELADNIARLHHFFQDKGLGNGERVVIASRNAAHQMSIFAAVVDAGLCAVIVNTSITASELGQVFTTVDASAMIADEDCIKLASANGHPLKFALGIKSGGGNKNLLGKLLGGKAGNKGAPSTYPAIIEQYSASTDFNDADPESTAYIMMTSGSTSTPKAVPTSRRSLFAHLATLQHQLGYTSNSCLLNILPLFHVDGLIHGPVAACFFGGQVHRPFEFSIGNIEPLLHSIYRERVSHFITVPTMLALITRLGVDYADSFNTEDFKFVLCSAGVLETQLWQSFEQHFGSRVVNMYGLTETVTGGLFSGPDDATYRQGTLGKPIDCNLRIVDSTLSDVNAGETGELLLSGDNIFNGYLDTENNDVFVDGWFRTGDLVHLDSDGFVVLDGRLKNVVICGGENIYPEEVTAALNSHPDIAEALAFGIESADWGEELVAVLVAHEGCSIDEGQIAQWCARVLSDFKIPRHWQMVDAIPRTESGKPLVTQCRDNFHADSAALNQADGDIEEQILLIASRIFKTPADQLSAGSSPDNVAGWDSLGHVNLVMDLEQAFGVSFSTLEVMNLPNLGRAIELVEAKRNDNA